MTAKDKPYKRLPGVKRGLLGHSVLWMGRDHLLSVYSTGFTEEYRRFYYADIQALAAYKTVAGRIQAILLSLAATLSAILTWRLGAPCVLSGFIAGCFCLWLIIHLLRGPTCECYLYTAIQVRKLPTLRRLGTARKVMEKLRPGIEAAQGGALSERARRNIPLAPETARPGDPASGVGRLRGADAAHRRLFSALLAVGLAAGVDYFFNHIVITLSGSLVSMAAIILAVIALVKQHDMGASGAVPALAWGAAGYLSADMVMGYVMYVYAMVEQPVNMGSQWRVITAFSRMSPADHPLLAGYFAFAVIGAFGLGAAGLLCLQNARPGGGRRPSAAGA